MGYFPRLGLETHPNGGSPSTTGLFLCPKSGRSYAESATNTKPARGISPPDHWPVSNSRRQDRILAWHRKPTNGVLS
jgi:hypothetical protein